MGVGLIEREETELGYRPEDVELSENIEGLLTGEVLSANLYIDRFEIERQASEIIATKSQNHNSYKTNKTYRDDARTALFEALTASGHLSLVKSERTSLDQIHQTMLSVLINAWSENLPQFEKIRRFQEICEELTIQQVEKRVAAGYLPPETEVATVSDFVTGAGEKQAIALGYRPYNKKGMVRSSRLINHHDGTFTRVSKQVSRSNADALESESLFSGMRISTNNKDLPADARVLGTQTLLTGSEAVAGVIGLMKRLDANKGKNIRYGERTNHQQPSYEDLEQESIRREQEAECYVERLAGFSYEIDQKLAAGLINKNLHQKLLSSEIYKILQAICTLRPEYAAECFGQAASATYEAAAMMSATGDTQGAAKYIESKAHLEQAVTLCGMTISKEEAAKQGIELDTLNQLLKLGKEKFKTKPGKCRVEECPSPKPSEVGPCDVCMCCQAKFDKKMTYHQIVRLYKATKKLANKAVKKTTNSVFGFFSYNKVAKREKIKT